MLSVFSNEVRMGLPGSIILECGFDRSHALRGNASRDALRHIPEAERGASLATFPRRSVGTIDSR
ncbi:hypothetical protein J2W43_001115 [Pseudomonas brassicacearum]|uniref:DUF1534 domain-containing protein n=1 Tax=Pseudomonas brassicacearum TaxID=930166 RepID=A0AAW8M6C5_9PSED|nr:hypothetical protein [Pseudomonas brassicacearum]